jgi:para-aminobenzoate synthetase component 1
MAQILLRVKNALRAIILLLAMLLPPSFSDTNSFKRKALQWASAFDVCCYMDSNGFADVYSKFDVLIAAGVKDELKCPAGNAFEQLQAFRKKNTSWVIGSLGYDLKNETENLFSENADLLTFPDLYFFVPEHLIVIRGEEIEIISDDVDAVLLTIEQTVINETKKSTAISLNSRFTRDEYIATVEQIQQHIRRGDIYETNFCQEFYAENVKVEPLSLFIGLNKISATPFACYLKTYDQYAICASPERFLAKRGTQFISQPIKGTARRSANEAEDEQLKIDLRYNAKEQQENVMIVDLVRNDLTKCARPATVVVKELFGIYSFEQVHQMISTVVCEKADNLTDVDVIKQMFPMGSMTGAPKFSAMHLMEKYERTKRGLYSGTIGYFDPTGDFDFNVVIRTLLFNAANGYLSFEVGSAITHNAIAEQEYDECLLKAKAILEVLGAS